MSEVMLKSVYANGFEGEIPLRDSTDWVGL